MVLILGQVDDWLSRMPMSSLTEDCSVVRTDMQRMAADFNQGGVSKLDRSCAAVVGFYFRSTELSVITYG